MQTVETTTSSPNSTNAFTLATRAFVNIYEDAEGRYIGDAEWETWEEAYSERDELSTYVETVEIVRRHGS